MKWVKFEFDSLVTWPKKDSKVIVRYFEHGHIRYFQTTWYWIFEKRNKSIYLSDYSYYDKRHDPKLVHDDNCTHPHTECFITHWCYLEEPNDGYWKEYKHENGNTYADKPYDGFTVIREEPGNTEDDFLL